MSIVEIELVAKAVPIAFLINLLRDDLEVDIF
jgi:hypothetical protein